MSDFANALRKHYPDWQHVKLTRLGYSIQREAAIIELNKAHRDNRKSDIKHFDLTHFTAVTIGGRKFVYCPVGNICSWSEGDYDHKWCHWCKKYFEEIL